MKYKYKINHYLNMLPRSITLDVILSVLQKDYGISQATFFRDRAIHVAQSKSIPTDRLDVYALLLGVKPEELKNYEMKGNSLIDRTNTEVQESGLIKPKKP